jgi:hypothetical protein
MRGTETESRPQPKKQRRTEMPLINVFHRPNRSDINVPLEKPYFSLWLLLLSIQSFLDPNTILVNDPQTPLTLAQLQARPDGGLPVNYLDLAEVSAVLGGASVLSPTQVSNVIHNALANFDAVYSPAITDFGTMAYAANSTINLYPIYHGCTGTQSVLDVLKAPISKPGAVPKGSKKK